MYRGPREKAETGLFREVWAHTNRLIAEVRRNSPLPGRNMRLSATGNGTMYSVDLSGVKTPESVAVTEYLLKAIEDDYLTVREWNGAAGAEANDTDLYIARVWSHRRSKFDGETIGWSSDGDTYTAAYTYESPTKRVVTIGATDENQVLIPHYKVDFSIIQATKASKPTGVLDPSGADISLVDNNADARAWTKLTV